MSASAAPELPPLDQTCPRCGKPNRCSMAAGAPAGNCWCMQEPPALADAPARESADSPVAPTSCFCQACLRALRPTS